MRAKTKAASALAEIGTASHSGAYAAVLDGGRSEEVGM